MRRLGIIALLATLPAAAAAQGGVTGDNIARAKKLYEAFQVDAARQIFQQIISPSYLNPVTLDQRVTAYKYLGAAAALGGSTDSAKTFFVAALEVDPFTDLGEEFSATELGPFLLAKSEVFHVGIRQPYSAVVNPRVDSTAYRFFLVTTHSANIQVELVRLPDSTQREMLYTGPTNGLREIKWDGLIRSAGGRLADSSNYIFRVKGTSNLRRGAGPAATEEQQQFIRIEHSYEPLEKLLPPLDSTTRLVEKISFFAPWADLAKGIFFGGLTYGFAAITLGSADVSWTTNAAVSTLVTAGAGFGSWFIRSRNRNIAAAVKENVRRDSLRTVFNDGVKARNDARLAKTLLIITPLTAGR